MTLFDLEFKPSKFGALSVVVYYHMEKETSLKCWEIFANVVRICEEHR